MNEVPEFLDPGFLVVRILAARICRTAHVHAPSPSPPLCLQKDDAVAAPQVPEDILRREPRSREDIRDPARGARHEGCDGVGAPRAVLGVHELVQLLLPVQDILAEVGCLPWRDESTFWLTVRVLAFSGCTFCSLRQASA